MRMTDIKYLDSLRDKNWEKFFIKLCGLDFQRYRFDEENLTREILETHLDEIVEKIINFIDYVFKPELRPRLPSYDGYWVLSMDDIFIGLQILGILILQTGAYLPDIVRRGILYSTLWEYDKKREWSEPFEAERKENLRKFREAIINHKEDKKIKITF
jgi:hypothetical protein